MVHWLFEILAEILGVARKRRPILLIPFVLGILIFALIAFVRVGYQAIPGVGVGLFFFVVPAVQVLRARSALWRSARAPVLDLRDPPTEEAARDLPSTARALTYLTIGVTHVRRGKLADADSALELIDRDLLLPDEERLFDGARAMLALGMGSPVRAASLASKALPTRVADFDLPLGRALVTDAWDDPDRLRSIDETWATSGVTPGTRDALPRLRAIVRLRIDDELRDALEPWEAKALADEARAVGDSALATDLESRSRPTAYR
ncbi:MAG: hypothetical protein R3B70_46205 [Polyangiaceae bacterium]